MHSKPFGWATSGAKAVPVGLPADSLKLMINCGYADVAGMSVPQSKVTPTLRNATVAVNPVLMHINTIDEGQKELEAKELSLTLQAIQGVHSKNWRELTGGLISQRYLVPAVLCGTMREATAVAAGG